MKSTQLLRASVIALAALAAGSTFAAGLTRAEVKAEYQAAKAADALPVGCELDVHNPYRGVVKSVSATTRTSVQASVSPVSLAQNYGRATTDWQPN
jgi:hypothetical protein